MFGTRWQRIQSYAALGAWTTLAIKDDDELNWKDFPETAILGMQLGLIWSPQIALAIGMSATPLNVVEGVFLVGLGASLAIGGLEGAETYIDYVSDPVDMITNPSKRAALTQAVEIEMALVNPAAWLGSWIGEQIGEALHPYRDVMFKNRFLTGPYLSF